MLDSVGAELVVHRNGMLPVVAIAMVPLIRGQDIPVVTLGSSCHSINKLLKDYYTMCDT